MSAQTDMDKASDMRALSKKAKSQAAKRKFDQAADRLELRAAAGANKAGRRKRKAAATARPR